jgi:hypothetical protein
VAKAATTGNLAEEDRELDIPDRQPDLLVVEDCASRVLDPKEEELTKQTQIQDIKDASQAIDRLLRLKTEQKKVYGREFVLYSAWRRRHGGSTCIKPLSNELSCRCQISPNIQTKTNHLTRYIAITMQANILQTPSHV